MRKISSADGYRWLWVSVANGREDAGCQLVVNTENDRKGFWELKSRMNTSSVVTFPPETSLLLSVLRSV